MSIRVAIAAVAVLAGVPTAAPAQHIASLLEAGPVDWSAWETTSRETRRELLEGFGICVDQPGMVESHHVFDFSGDGIDDLIYSGDDVTCDGPGSSAKRTALFQALYGEFSEIFVHNGVIVDLWRAAPWQPVSFLIRAEDCCGSVFVHYYYFYPAEGRRDLRYDSYNHMVAVVDMPAPEIEYSRPRPFSVRRGPYSLRVTPGDDPDFVWPYARPHDPTGNLLATYRSGAAGIALGEAEGPDGRRWWFVLMDPSSRPLGIRGFQGAWESSPPGRGYLGWMSPDGLLEIDWWPRGLDTERYWRSR
ncbi:MAG: hypothetical protein GWN32_01150 [Gemmatimonadetes bacterium]|nr:hypothetical protein [Gemmatimonadota bacterium]